MTIRRLQLVIPDVLPQLRALSAQLHSLSELPTLVHCLTYGRKSQLWQADDLSHARVDTWQQSLLYALPRECRHFGAASAKLTWLGEVSESPAATCFQVMPVHFQVGLDDVRCLMPPPLSSSEAELMYESLKPLVSSAGFTLIKQHLETGLSWYLCCDKELRVNTFSLRNLTHSRLFHLMPQGADAGELRRLMTEVQMLLHDHPVNQQRQQQGILPVNALWFYGHAPITSVSCAMKAVVLSHSPYVRGLCHGLNLQCLAPPNDVSSLLSHEAENMLLVVPEQSLQSVEQQWLQKLFVGLLKGQIGQLDIYVDNWCVTLSGGRWAHWCRRLQGKQQEIKEYFS